MLQNGLEPNQSMLAISLLDQSIYQISFILFTTRSMLGLVMLLRTAYKMPRTGDDLLRLPYKLPRTGDDLLLLQRHQPLLLK